MTYALDARVREYVGAAGAKEKTQDAAIAAADGKAVAAAQFTPSTASIARPVYQRLRDSVSALDLMSAGGLDEAVRNREATSADASEVTTHMQEAVTACAAKRWRLDLPAGRYWLDAQLQAERPMQIIGAGMDATELSWDNASATEGIRILAGGVVANSAVTDLTLVTGKIAATDPIILDYSSLISGGTLLPRAETHGKVARVRTKGADGYTVNGWRRGVLAESLLGLDVDGCRFNGVYTGAYGSMPQALAGIDFGGAGSPVQLTVRSTVISAVQDAVLTRDAEGVYITGGCEFVTVGAGYRCVNAANESGLVIADTHIATVSKGVVLERMAEAAIKSVIFYNVADATPIDFITIGAGCDDIVIADNIFRRLGTTPIVRSIVATAGDGIIIGKNLHDIGSSNTAIHLSGSARALVHQQAFEGVSSSAPIISTSNAAQFETFRGFAGDLNSINTDWRMPRQTHFLVGGVTNVPSAWTSTAGAIVETLSFDANTAWQIARHPNLTTTVHQRRKSGGTWSEWTGAAA